MTNITPLQVVNSSRAAVMSSSARSGGEDGDQHGEGVVVVEQQRTGVLALVADARDGDCQKNGGSGTGLTER